MSDKPDLQEVLHAALCACGSLDEHDDQVEPDDAQPIRADFLRAVEKIRGYYGVALADGGSLDNPIGEGAPGGGEPEPDQLAGEALDEALAGLIDRTRRGIITEPPATTVRATLAELGWELTLRPVGGQPQPEACNCQSADGRCGEPHTTPTPPDSVIDAPDYRESLRAWAEGGGRR